MSKNHLFFVHDDCPTHDILASEIGHGTVVQDKLLLLKTMARFLVKLNPSPLFRRDVALLIWHFFTLGRMKFWKRYEYLIAEECPGNQEHYFGEQSFYQRYDAPKEDAFIKFIVDEEQGTTCLPNK